MAGSAGSIAQFFPDIFGGGAAMSGAGSAATTTTAATGAGSMALGPWMLASAGIQGLTNIAGGLMGQQSQREAINAAEEQLVRNWGFDTWQRDKERAAQAQALREGYGFMRSPVFQSKGRQDFAEDFALAGKFYDPYTQGLAMRMRG
jgi:hypothetical protein